MDSPRLHVLIVLSDTATVDTLTRSLRRRGHFAVTTASSVDLALDLLDARLPDAVLLGLTLSMMSSHALLHRLRQTPESARLPVFVLTGRHDGVAIKAATRAGVNGFISQPLNGVEIAYKIEQAVHDRRSRAAEVIDLLRPDPVPGTPARTALP